MIVNLSKEKSDIPFGIYRINKDYISFLQKYDSNVLDPEYTNRYCGPVIRVDSERGPADYFVPILPDYDEMTGYLVNFRDGVLAGFMDFKKSIPCL
ncbi:MAG: type III toxin-antitoxin system ToxN/AbiQ family toxin [Oscillospiraceae bacterium]|nr:type III toxin-antitoxin system ToxN/AbiQ family toxin [Oscillospiraceae bacterium]